NLVISNLIRWLFELATELFENSSTFHRLFIDFGTVGIYDGFSVLIVISNAAIAQAASKVHSRS
ncbi:MAG: hypothetical protein WCD53_23180, partial [Microcoleus sp.]